MINLFNLSRSLFLTLANHPLFIEAPVYHLLTSEQVKIKYYRQNDGIPLKPGLVCSIFPAYNNSETISPSARNVAAIFDAGEEIRQTYVHFIVKFYWSEVNIDLLRKNKNEQLITTLKKYPYYNIEELDETETVQQEYYEDSGFYLISKYLELATFALADREHRQTYAIDKYLRDLVIVHLNYPTSVWNEEANCYYHHGHLFLRMTIDCCTDWKEVYSVYHNLEKIEAQLINPTFLKSKNS